MEKTEQLYEGKAKKVFATDDKDYVIVSYKDDATGLTTLTFDGDKVTAKVGVVSVEGTYKIDGDKITLTFGNDTLKLGGEKSFAKDGNTITIGGAKYTKQ